MYKPLFLFLLFLSIAFLSRSQHTAATKLTGKWYVCYSADLKDTSCTNPAALYVFKPGGKGSFKKLQVADSLPVEVTWQYQNKNLSIVYDGNHNRNYPPDIFRIVFLNDHLFYYTWPGDKSDSNPHLRCFFRKRADTVH